ncbi:hypothetical protein [Neobacillus sp. LXY-4]|uniref:hypothetical protein n=1 Tax=Neobacillus sp. LXY-4 TaxID=3379826 RepID=UPI003EE01504
MTTYKKIQEYIKQNHGYTPKTCWIANMKEIYGLNPRVAHNRYSPNSRTNPCPENKKEDLKEAFKYFKLI